MFRPAVSFVPESALRALTFVWAGRETRAMKVSVDVSREKTP